MTGPVSRDQLAPMDLQVLDWLEANLGMVTKFVRHGRWRPGWDAIVQRDGKDLPIYVRGPRGESYGSPIDMVQEAEIHHAFEAHGIPVPHVYGMIDDPVSIVMDLIPGRINTGLIEDPTARQRVRDQFIDIVAKVHSLPLTAFAKMGVPVPASPQEAARALYGPSYAIFQERIGRPFPLMHFVAQWLDRNVPQDRERISFVNYDAGQFLHDDDKVTGLIDFEVSHFGDPASELAGMRLRDTTEPLGDLSAMIDRYEGLTGDRISKRLIEYFSAAFCGVNGFLLWPLAYDSTMEQDYTAYMNYSVATSRWTITAIAEHLGISLVNPSDPVIRPLGFSRAAEHLVEQLGTMPDRSAAEDYSRDSAAALARYLGRWNDYGQAILEQDLAEASALVGRTLATWDDAQAAVEDYVRAAPPSEDARLTQHFHNWLRRQDFLLRGCGQASYLVDRDMQPIAPRANDRSATDAPAAKERVDHGDAVPLA